MLRNQCLTTRLDYYFLSFHLQTFLLFIVSIVFAEIKFLRNPPGALGSQSFTAKLDAASAAIVGSPPNVVHTGGHGGHLCGSCSNWYPPVITRTAATPQGSPAALDLNTTDRDVLDALDHQDIDEASSMSHLALNFVSASIVSIDKTPVRCTSARAQLQIRLVYLSKALQPIDVFLEPPHLQAG